MEVEERSIAYAVEITTDEGIGAFAVALGFDKSSLVEGFLRVK